MSFAEAEVEILADVLFPHEELCEDHWMSVFPPNDRRHERATITLQRFLTPLISSLTMFNDEESSLLEDKMEIQRFRDFAFANINRDKEERMMAIRLEWEQERLELEEQHQGEESSAARMLWKIKLKPFRVFARRFHWRKKRAVN